MEKHLFIIYFISLIISSYSLPSDDICNTITKHIEERRGIIDRSMRYLLFDESDYTKISGDMEKKETLTGNFEKIFEKYRFYTYIFIVDNIDEKKESIDDVAYTLGEYLYMKYKIFYAKSLIILLSIKTRRISIVTGRYISKNYIGYSKAHEIIKDIQNFFNEKQYYETIIRLQEDILNYCFKKRVYTILLFVLCIGFLALYYLCGCNDSRYYYRGRSSYHTRIGGGGAYSGSW